VLLGLYLLGIGGAILTALVLKRTALRGPTPTFLMALPAYRWPQWRMVVLRLYDRARVFVLRAGTVIFVVSVVIWAISYFPRSVEVTAEHVELREAATSQLDGQDLEERLAEIDRLEAAAMLEQSLLGRCGRLIEPVFRPLGWDWRVSAAVLASFPAREVVIAALGTIYALGDDVSETAPRLKDRLRGATWPDGRPVIDLPVAVGIMIFFALCLQCVATVATMRRETNSWRWPLAAWLYMTALGWLGAWVTVHGARWVIE
jgi:ferrous iron transport protein B